MATRSQSYHAEQQRHHDGASAQKARVKARIRAEHQAKARHDHASQLTHNQAARASERSTYQLEPGTRKSTRLAANRAKSDSSLRKTVTVRSVSPKARAGRSKEGGRS